MSTDMEPGSGVASDPTLESDSTLAPIEQDLGRPAKETLLACRGVVMKFGGLVAVNDANIDVPPGKIVGLVGPNGAGKSTLFGVLSGLLRPTQGSVWMNGDRVTDASPQDRAMRGMARTYQHPQIFTGLTVSDHLLLAYRTKVARRRLWADLFTLGGLRPMTAEERSHIDELIELAGLQALANRPAIGLPLGVARLVELGRALASSPSVLLLDEPSSGLDSTETAAFEATLRRVVRERGSSVLLVEHDVEMVMRLCDQVNVLDFGQMIASGTPAEVRADPKVRAAYLGEEVTAVEGAEGTTTVGAGSEATPAAPGKDALTVENLCVRYGDAVALTDVSFTLGKGRVLALIGPNGAGKSSVARAVSGLIRPSSGTIRFEGIEVDSSSAHKIRRADVVHLPEGRGVFRSLSVLDNLRMATATMKDRKARKAALDNVFEIFPVLSQRRGQLAGLLSGGEQQMLSMARALASSPRLVIADEMSLGLAPLMVDLVFESFGRAREAGVTMILIEQYVHRALGFADDCVVLQHGQVAWQGPAANAKEDVLRHYLGDAMAAAS